MFVVKYVGQFGYIKPWTAVRDGETYSQQFLTPSIIEGIEKKLFPQLIQEKGIRKIIRHKLSGKGISVQQEQVQTIGWKERKIRGKSIIKRGVMLYPELLLAFEKKDDAVIAASQHICLCRNEDIMLPEQEIIEMSDSEFASIKGFELRFEKNSKSFIVGYNRFADNEPMSGCLEIDGKSIL